MTARPLLILAACLPALLAGPTPCALAQPDQPAFSLPADYLHHRLDHVRKQLADCDRQLALAAEPNALLQAQRNLWQMTANLLQVGQSGSNQAALASLYGLTLARHAGQFEPTIRPVMQAARLALRHDDRQALDRLTRIASALHQFNLRCQSAINALPDGSADSVDRYLGHLLAPLEPLCRLLQLPAPVDTWITSHWDQPGLALDTALQALAERIHESAALSQESRQLLLDTTDMMQQALELPALQPRLAGLYHQVLTLIDLAEALSAARDLGPQAGPAIIKQVEQLARLLHDPHRRHQAVARLAGLERLARLLTRFKNLQAQQVPVAPAYKAIAFILDQPPDAPHVPAILDRLDALASASTAYRAIKPNVLPLDVRRAFGLLSRQFQRLEETSYISLKLIDDDPALLTQPRWQEPADQLTLLVEQLQMINRIPQWLTRVKAINPNAGPGLYRQLRATVANLTQPATAPQATEALRQMNRQLELFERLPHEDLLLQADSALGQLAADQAEVIHRQILSQRSLWAAAWNAGQDPTEPGRRLLLLRRLLLALHEGAGLADMEQPFNQLNRWAGWEIDPALIGPMLASLPGLLKSAAAAAAAADWQNLATSLDQYDGQVGIARLMARLIQGTGKRLADMPGGLSSMLGQCLYPPPPGAFGQPHRLQLAQLCALIEASSTARRDDQHATADMLWNQACQLAAHLLELWTRPTWQLQPAPKVPAPPSPQAVDV